MVTVFGLRRIILRQAMRAIRPGMANDTIGMIKGTSIAWVIFVNELTFRSQQIVGQNFKFFTVFAAAGVIYLMLTSAISLLWMWRNAVVLDFVGWLRERNDDTPVRARAGVYGLDLYSLLRSMPQAVAHLHPRRPRRASDPSAG